MQLKYLKGERIKVYMGRKPDEFRFSPVGEIPEPFAKHLLKTRPSDFEIYNEPHKVVEEVDEAPVEQKEQFKCDQCGSDFSSNAGLSAHKRFKHKEK